MSDDSHVSRVPDSEISYDSDLIYMVNGKPFTGIGYEEHPTLGLSEITYRDGLQDGVSRDWYPSGRLRGESHYRENSLHGPMREYDEQGVVRLECLYDHGFLIRSVTRDASGRVLESFERDESDPQYRLLERYRRETQWPPPDQ